MNTDASAARPVMRPLYWSIRRELWENRSVYIAPFAVAALLLAGFVIGTRHLVARTQHIAALDPSVQGARVALEFNIVAVTIVATSLMISVFYCLGALHNERRDRSILFWKSLPVSDFTTVLAKACVPLLVLPVLAFIITVSTQMLILAASVGILLLNGINPGIVLAGYSPLPRAIIVMYSVAVLALWNAPIFGWLMLVSAWPRGKIFLWATLPPLALCVAEKIAFDTSELAWMLGHHLIGVFSAAFDVQNRTSMDISQLSELDPVGFVTNSGLWAGLVIALLFYTAAIWLRRYRDPI
jgi:ABC-2 type transport system permease protein